MFNNPVYIFLFYFFYVYYVEYNLYITFLLQVFGILYIGKVNSETAH